MDGVTGAITLATFAKDVVELALKIQGAIKKVCTTNSAGLINLTVASDR
jgi:hypothetical protein